MKLQIKRKPKAGAKGGKAIYIAIDTAGRYWYWKIANGESSSVESVPDNSAVIRLTDRDVRVLSEGDEKPVVSAINRLNGQVVLVPNRKNRKISYATLDSEEWLEPERKIRAAPATAILDMALEGGTLPAVAGFRLEGSPSVLVLWPVTEAGINGEPVISIDPIDESEPIRVAAERMQLLEYDTRILGPEELWKRLTKKPLTPYPVKGEWMGMSSLQILLGIAAVAGLMALSAKGFDFYTKNNIEVIRAKIVAAQDLGPIQAGLNRVIHRHGVAYANQYSADIGRLLEASRKLWKSGLVVRGSATRQGEQITVLTENPIAQKNDDRTLSLRETFTRLIAVEPPAGYRIKSRRLDGAGKTMLYELERTAPMNQIP